MDSRSGDGWAIFIWMLIFFGAGALTIAMFGRKHQNPGQQSQVTKTISPVLPTTLTVLMHDFADKPYRELVEYHLRRGSTDQLMEGAVRMIASLPWKVIPVMEEVSKGCLAGFLPHPEVWQSTSSLMLQVIIGIAHKKLVNAGIVPDDETLFRIFQTVTLQFAHLASLEPELQELMRIDSLPGGEE